MTEAARALASYYHLDEYVPAPSVKFESARAEVDACLHAYHEARRRYNRMATLPMLISLVHAFLATTYLFALTHLGDASSWMCYYLYNQMWCLFSIHILIMGLLTLTSCVVIWSALYVCYGRTGQSAAEVPTRDAYLHQLQYAPADLARTLVYNALCHGPARPELAHDVASVDEACATRAQHMTELAHVTDVDTITKLLLWFVLTQHAAPDHRLSQEWQLTTDERVPVLWQ